MKIINNDLLTFNQLWADFSALYVTSKHDQNINGLDIYRSRPFYFQYLLQLCRQKCKSKLALVFACHAFFHKRPFSHEYIKREAYDSPKPLSECGYNEMCLFSRTHRMYFQIEATREIFSWQLQLTGNTSTRTLAIGWLLSFIMIILMSFAVSYRCKQNHIK